MLYIYIISNITNLISITIRTHIYLMILPGIALYIMVNITSTFGIGTNMNIFILRKVPKKQT